MQLPPREARGNLASVELPVEELSSTPGCSCTALGLWGLAGSRHGFAQSTVRSRQGCAVPCMEHTGTQLHGGAGCKNPCAPDPAKSNLLPWLVWAGTA